MQPQASRLWWSLLRVPRLLRRRGFASTAPTASTESGEEEEEFDVAIVGGGPVGLSIACGLATTTEPKLRVLLLEAGRFPAAASQATKNVGDVGGFSSRAVALSPSSVALLRRLGAWDDADDRVAPIRRMRVAESDSDAVLTFDSSSSTSPGDDAAALAYVTELAPVVARLAERAAAAGVRLRQSCRLAGFASPNDFARPSLRLRLADGGGLVGARLLIGCDGFGSPVRRMAGIGAVDLPYAGHRAMAATLEIAGSNGLGGEAFQRFLPSGPIALLPLPGRHASLVWCSRADHIARLVEAPEAAFLADINRCLATGGGGGGSTASAPLVTGLQPGSRLAFPLGFMHASRYTLGRVALAGDAAHRLSPLAGQGMNLGMADAASLVRLMAEAAGNGADPADPTYLLDYETERQRQVVPVAMVNEALGLLYSLPSDSCLAAPLRLARSVGFRLTDRLPTVKEFLRRSATAGRIDPAGLFSLA